MFIEDQNIQHVPTVLLVLEGGPGTLGTVIAAVTGNLLGFTYLIPLNFSAP